MKIRELVEDRDREPLKQFMQKRGYRYIGEGNYALVFQKNKNVVLKVYGVDKTVPIFGTFDPLVFYRVSKKINNPFVPKFGTPRKFTVDGINYIAIPSERLSKHPQNPNMQQAWSMYYSSHWPNSGTAIESLEKALKEANRSRQKQIKKAINTLKTVNPKILDGYRETVDQVCKDLNCDDLSMPGNIMWRGNRPIINDPYAYTEYNDSYFGR